MVFFIIDGSGRVGGGVASIAAGAAVLTSGRAVVQISTLVLAIVVVVMVAVMMAVMVMMVMWTTMVLLLNFIVSLSMTSCLLVEVIFGQRFRCILSLLASAVLMQIVDMMLLVMLTMLIM